MPEPRWLPDRDGLHGYVRTSRTMGHPPYEALVWAPSLKEAKAKHGWTRQRFVTITMRRATPADANLRTYQ